MFYSATFVKETGWPIVPDFRFGKESPNSKERHAT